jgi:HEAT repeat protein
MPYRRMRFLITVALALLTQAARVGAQQTGAVDSAWVAARLQSIELRGPDARAAVEDLMAHADQARPFVERTLRGADEHLQWTAAQSLAHMGVPGVAVLLASVRDTTLRGSAAARSALEFSGERAALEGVAGLLSDPDARVRRRAAGLLQTATVVLEDGDWLVPLVRPSLHDPDAEVRGGAALAIGVLHPSDPETIGALSALLHDPDPDVRENAAMAFVHAGPAARTAVPALAEALRTDTNAEARIRAAQALGYMGDTVAIPALLGAARDRSSDVRLEAVGALGEIGLPRGPDARRVLDLLAPLALTGNGMTAQSAAQALAQMDERATPALLRVLAEGGDSTAVVAAAALGFRPPSTEVTDALYRALGARHGVVRDAAADALAGLGSAQLPRLRALAGGGGASAAGAARALRLLQAATAVRVAERCYALARGPWTPSLDIGVDSTFSAAPAVVRFTTHPAGASGARREFMAVPANGAGSHVLPAATWSAPASDSLSIVWSTGFSGVSMALRILPDSTLRGTATPFWDFPREKQSAEVTGTRVECRQEREPVADEGRR